METNQKRTAADLPEARDYIAARRIRRACETVWFSVRLRRQASVRKHTPTAGVAGGLWNVTDWLLLHPDELKKLKLTMTEWDAGCALLARFNVVEVKYENADWHIRFDPLQAEICDHLFSNSEDSHEEDIEAEADDTFEFGQLDGGEE